MSAVSRVFRQLPNGVEGAGLGLARSFSSTASSTAELKALKPKTFSIYRWDPKHAKKPRLENYMILSKIKNETDPSLTFRRSCREGICGSCAMNINGYSGLSCLTKIDTASDSSTTITPLWHMFVIKDLVVHMTNFYNEYNNIESWLKRKTPPADGKEILQSKKDRANLDGIYECILCACCITSCPSYWWKAEKYLGPAALLDGNMCACPFIDSCILNYLYIFSLMAFLFLRSNGP